MAYEWGPWIDHDGKSCPPQGAVAHVLIGMASDGTLPSQIPSECWAGLIRHIADDEAIVFVVGPGGWLWQDGWFPVIRYRLRKPLGLQILEALLTDLPERVEP